jgi:small conductance mechanosensitive channel
MTQMEDLLSDIETGINALGALAVSYSFSVLGAILLLIAGYFIAGLVERGILAGLGQVRQFDATLRHFFAATARYVVLALVLVMVLGQFGVQTASIVAAIGAAGLAIGLALQGTLQNIAAGIMLLFLRPFRIGEDIEVGAIEGTVEEIGLFATRLRRSDGIYILAPNSKLWNEPVRNFSRNRMRRNDIAVAIRYENDVDHAERTLTELAEADQRVKKAPKPIAFVSEIRENGVIVTLRYWTSDVDWFRTKLDLTHRLKAGFDERGIAALATPPEMLARQKSIAEQAPVGRA